MPHVNLQAPYTWDDPMKIMNGDERDRFEAAAAIRAEMAAGKETDMGELGFLQHDVDTVDTEKQDL